MSLRVFCVLFFAIFLTCLSSSTSGCGNASNETVDGGAVLALFGSEIVLPKRLIVDGYVYPKNAGVRFRAPYPRSVEPHEAPLGEGEFLAVEMQPGPVNRYGDHLEFIDSEESVECQSENIGISKYIVNDNLMNFLIYDERTVLFLVGSDITEMVEIIAPIVRRHFLHEKCPQIFEME